MDGPQRGAGVWARLTATRGRRVLLRLAFYSAVLLLALPWSFSQVLLGTQRQPTTRPPAGIEEIRIVSEGLRLRAWVAPGERERPVVVAVHGVGDSLESWTEVASVMRGRGHGVLLLDLRGHGGSEGRYTTLGGREREDVRAAIAEAGRRGLADSGLVLMGWSMGAVAVLRAAAGRDDVRAVVAEAPFDTYRASVARHARLLFGIPGWLPLLPATIALAEWRAGFDADAVDAVAAARRIRAPLLAIADGDDPRMPPEVVRRVFDAHPGPKRLWVAEHVDHVGAILRPDYWTTVLGFLEGVGASRPPGFAVPAAAQPPLR